MTARRRWSQAAALSFVGTVISSNCARPSEARQSDTVRDCDDDEESNEQLGKRDEPGNPAAPNGEVQEDAAAPNGEAQEAGADVTRSGRVVNPGGRTMTVIRENYGVGCVGLCWINLIRGDVALAYATYTGSSLSTR